MILPTTQYLFPSYFIGWEVVHILEQKTSVLGYFPHERKQ